MINLTVRTSNKRESNTPLDEIERELRDLFEKKGIVDGDFAVMVSERTQPSHHQVMQLVGPSGKAVKAKLTVRHRSETRAHVILISPSNGMSADDLLGRLKAEHRPPADLREVYSTLSQDERVALELLSSVPRVYGQMRFPESFPLHNEARNRFVGKLITAGVFVEIGTNGAVRREVVQVNHTKFSSLLGIHYSHSGGTAPPVDAVDMGVGTPLEMPEAEAEAEVEAATPHQNPPPSLDEEEGTLDEERRAIPAEIEFCTTELAGHEADHRSLITKIEEHRRALANLEERKDVLTKLVGKLRERSEARTRRLGEIDARKREIVAAREAEKQRKLDGLIPDVAGLLEEAASSAGLHIADVLRKLADHLDQRNK